jgi:hypothetical protein
VLHAQDSNFRYCIPLTRFHERVDVYDGPGITRKMEHTYMDFVGVVGWKMKELMPLDPLIRA